MEYWRNTGIKAEVVDEIRQIAGQYQVKRVLLFGSRARGDFQRASDIDLAVEGGDVTSFALDVNDRTSTLLEFDIVDLENEFIISGIIDKFFVQFELGWKVLKEYIPEFQKLRAQILLRYKDILETL